MAAKRQSLAPNPPHNGDKEAILWPAYRRHPTAENRNALVLAYEPLVRKCVGIQIKRLPRCVDAKELRACANLGLMEAIPEFDPKRGTKFETFATWRIRGSILDGLREADSMTRTQRLRQHALTASESALEGKLGRPPTHEERRRRLGWTQAQYLERTVEVRAAQVRSFPSASDGTRAHQEPDPRAQPPSAKPTEDDLFALARRCLNREERILLTCYYQQDLTMKQIGTLLELSEARVCQMHADILVRLGERLGEYDYANSGTTSRSPSNGREPADG